MRRTTTAFCVAMLAVCVSGCDAVGTILSRLFASPTQSIGVAIVEPVNNAGQQIGATIFVRWADLVFDTGTLVTVEALRLDANDEVVNTEVILENRDALADGDADVLEFDSTTQMPGRYQFRVSLASPDGQTAEATTTAIITLNN